MAAYIAQRILLTIPTLFVVTLVIFFALRATPGDPTEVLASSGALPPESIAAMRHELDLDQPISSQYLSWIGHLAQGDLGHSFTGVSGASVGQRTPVGDLVRRALPITLELGILSLLIALAIAVPAGVTSAVNYNSWLDQSVRFVVVLGLSVPVFWLGTLAIVLPAVWWGYVPPLTHQGLLEHPVRNVQQFALPAFLLGLVLAASTARLLRSSMLDVLRQDYIRTARAKGMGPSVVVIRHGLRNAIIPVITHVGAQLGIVVGGSAVIETIFNLPGMGLLLVGAVGRHDYPIVQAVALVISVFVVIVNLAIDISYGFIDPRIRHARTAA